MRIILLALGFLVALAATPAAAAACGDPGSTPSVAGRAFRGNAVWSAISKANVTVTFNADCTATYTVYLGATRSGTWTQTGDQLVLNLPEIDIRYDGVVQGDTYKGTMYTTGSIGAFSLAETHPAPGPAKTSGGGRPAYR